MAREGTTILGEVLGASNGSPNQRFRTIYAPVLAGHSLEIREPISPAQDAAKLPRLDDGPGTDQQFWVPWHEVPNFFASGPRDRHYVLDRILGEVVFGDGINGLVPPPMDGNIRLAFYRWGGGSTGNKSAFAVNKIKTAVPYIDKVVNWEDAGGGGDAEAITTFVNRGPRILRHRYRAVTRQDFEDLAVLSSTQVARASCVPTYDLRRGGNAQQRIAGLVSVIIVPRSADAMPRPSAELLDCVRSYLLDSALPTVEMILVGPEYVALDIDVEVVVCNPDTATETELAVAAAIESYLHPVTGGREHAGWEFGRQPHRSELCAMIEDVSGVSRVRQLEFHLRPLQEGLAKDFPFLICNGDHRIAATLEE
jgi:predicted phage baseplate assembly protein